MLEALGEEVLRDQGAWGGTLVLHALHWAALHAEARSLGWQLCYRWALLAGWILAAVPLGLALMLQRWQARRRRDAFLAMQHWAGHPWRVLGLLLGTGLLLTWPAPLPAGWVAGWAGAVWLGVVLML
jgi:hypothetical protein